MFAVRAFVLGDGLAQQVGAAAPEMADVAAAQAVFDELVQERQPVARFAFGAVSGQYGEQRFEAVKALCEALQQVRGGKRAAGGDGAAVQVVQLLARLVNEHARLGEGCGIGRGVRFVAPGGDEARQFAFEGDEGRVKLQQAFVKADEVGRKVFGAETYREHFQRVGAFFAHEAAGAATLFVVFAEAGEEAEPLARRDGGEPVEVAAAVEDAVEHVLQLAFVHGERVPAVVEQGCGFVDDAGAGEDADADEAGVEVQVLQPAVDVCANQRAVRGRGVQFAGKGGEAFAGARRPALAQPFGKVAQHP